jgi:hypothetical protein
MICKALATFRSVRFDGRIFFLICTFLFGCLAANAGENGWLLKQWSTVAGSQEVLLTRSRMKIRNRDREVIMIVNAGNNTILTFSDQKKLYLVCPISDYKGPPTVRLLNILGLQERDFRTAKASVGTAFGHRATIYNILPAVGHPLAKSRQEGDPGYYASQVGCYWTFDDLAVDKSLARTLCRSYAIMPIDKIPCRLEYKQFGHNVRGFYTSSCTRARVSQADFAVPAGYKMVRDESELISGKGLSAVASP